MKTILIAAVFAAATGAAIVPIQAANLTINTAACDSTYSVTDNATQIQQRLAEKGISVSDVEDWGGCARAYFIKSDGSVGMAIFDPATLQQVGGDMVTRNA